MVLNFSKPTYTSVTNADTGKQEPSHIFTITTDGNEAKDTLSGVYDTSSSSPLQFLKETLLPQNAIWVNYFVGEFLKTASKYFAKPYSTETLLRLLRHELRSSATPVAPVSLTYTPVELRILRNGFHLVWDVAEEPLILVVPDEEEAPITVATVATTKPELWVKKPYAFSRDGHIQMDSADAESIPMSTSNEVISLGSPPPSSLNLRHASDRQWVKEAHLRAKLALIKAERVHTEYIEKYGKELSDSDSDTSDDETTDDETNAEDD